MPNRLFTPGPTPVPDEVMRRMAEPMAHHRHAEFRTAMERVNGGLRYVFQTAAPVLSLAASGTGGMEAIVVNLFSPGEKVIAVNGGKFGERWTQLLSTYGMRPVEITVPWGSAVSSEEIARTLRSHPDAKGILLTQSETSTGTAIDLKGIAATVRSTSDALLVVDGISSVAALEMRFDAWGIDACVTASQKGLMVPPGLAFVALSDRACEAIGRSRSPRYYLDLARALRSYQTNDTPWTPAISLLMGLDTALGMIRAEGIEQVWARHSRVAQTLREGIRALGLSLFSRAPSDSVTAVLLPEGVEWQRFNAFLKAEGVMIAGGQGDFAGKIFRAAHLGFCSDSDMEYLLSALGRALRA